MELKNSTLDDIATVVGFSATLRLSAWFSDGNNLYIPPDVTEEHQLSKLIGFSAAKALCREWPTCWLAVPSVKAYEVDLRRRMTCRMLEQGFNTREIGKFVHLSERRVQQIQRELEMAGLIDPLTVVKRVKQKAASESTGDSL